MRNKSNKYYYYYYLFYHSLRFFLCISRAQTMHLERQSLKSIIIIVIIIIKNTGLPARVIDRTWAGKNVFGKSLLTQWLHFYDLYNS